MRLSKLYSNSSDIFEPIIFNRGLNIVLAEIRLPENKLKDTHNLGKTTLLKLIDFCLLKKKSNDFFLFKHEDIFRDFVFYIEIETNRHKYITIRRSVKKASRIYLKSHTEPYHDFSMLSEDSWDHADLPFEKARQLLDGISKLDIAAPWSYRIPLGYSLRSQKDYHDVFELDKFRGDHADWKPYLAKLIGFDSRLMSRNYEITKEIEEKKKDIIRKKRDLLGAIDEADKLEGLILIKTAEISKIENELSKFDFRVSDSDINKDLVSDIETKIAALNERRYYLDMSRKRIEKSLSDKFSFDLEMTQKLFSEAKIYFDGQLKKEFEDLLQFNRTITEEREQYLRQEMENIASEKQEIEKELVLLNKRRSEALAILRERESFSKYKKMGGKLIELKADSELLLRQKKAFTELRDLQKELSGLEREREKLKEEITDNIAEPNRRYQNIRLYFSDIIKRVLDRDAVISTRVNESGNLEYSAEILNDSGQETSEALGNTYQKLLCIAFDMAVLREYICEDFIRFVYHDGIFEGLDDRKKENLIEIMREYSMYGIQQIATMIDSDLPITPEGNRYRFETTEIIKILHDEGTEGRLFKMPIW